MNLIHLLCVASSSPVMRTHSNVDIIILLFEVLQPSSPLIFVFVRLGDNMVYKFKKIQQDVRQRFSSLDLVI